jgi:hypothetical protein
LHVEISRIEMELTIPTFTLLTGIYKLSPLELVEGTTYPTAKAEHLPEVANHYTELELQLALLSNDLEWLKRLEYPQEKPGLIDRIFDSWSALLEAWKFSSMDERER